MEQLKSVAQIGGAHHARDRQSEALIEELQVMKTESDKMKEENQKLKRLCRELRNKKEVCCLGYPTAGIQNFHLLFVHGNRTWNALWKA